MLFDPFNPTGRRIFLDMERRFKDPKIVSAEDRLDAYLQQTRGSFALQIDYADIEHRILALGFQDFNCCLSCGCHDSPSGRNHPDRACEMCLTLLCGY